MKLRWVLAAVAGVAGYFAVFGGEYSLLDVRRLEKEREKEMEQLDSTRAEVKRLEARADSLEKDSATLERIAREKYGLIRAGERLYRFAGGSAAAPAAADSAVPPATRPEPAPRAPSSAPVPAPLPRGARQARGPARTPTRFAAPAKAGNDFRGVVRPAARRRP
ncbi:MAG TPA: septum formation initiator family protein [Longimicrobiales bacterium]|nr:septum formation initiator family protein [Longimicrobiales bacterium]